MDPSASEGAYWIWTEISGQKDTIKIQGVNVQEKTAYLMLQQGCPNELGKIDGNHSTWKPGDGEVRTHSWFIYWSIFTEAHHENPLITPVGHTHAPWFASLVLYD